MDSPFKQYQGAEVRRDIPTREVSGVHEAQTEPAPYLEDDDRITEETMVLVGSLPVSAIGVDYEPLVSVEGGETVGYEVHARCAAPGLHAPDDLFARALFEHRIGELCRVLREQAFAGGGSQPLFVSLHSQELKEGLLLRPDDPMALSDSEVYLQLSQPSLSAVCMQVLQELRGRGEVSLVVDNLGAGQSSLLQLIELHPRLVKLDPRLTAGLEADSRRRASVQHIVGMCASLGCAVAGKGVRTVEELSALVDCGVSYVQGPLIGGQSNSTIPGRLPA